MARVYLTKILGICSLLCSTVSLGFPEDIRVLSWFGYIKKDAEVARIEKKCNVNISVDEFYTNEESLIRSAHPKTNFG